MDLYGDNDRRSKRSVSRKYVIDIEIDSITDCLIDKATGEIVPTVFNIRKKPIIKRGRNEWSFDWRLINHPKDQVIELFVEGSSEVQGRLAFTMGDGFIDVSLAESAKHNRGKNRKYEGVGSHLFAIACKLSFEAGCEGYVAFRAKTNLIDHYQKTLHAQRVQDSSLLIIGPKAAKILVEKYFKEVY